MGLLNTPRLLLPNPNTCGWFGSTLSVGSATDKVAQIISAPKAGAIDLVEFATATVTTGCTLEVRLETVDTSTGDPTGTLLAAGASGTVVVANSDDSVWKTCSIGTPPTVTRGQRFAVVFVVSSGTPSSLLLRTCSLNYGDVHHFTDRYTASAWTKTAAPLAMALRYSGDGGSYTPTPGLFSARTATNISLATNTTPDEAGNKIVVPFRCRYAGIWWRAQASTGDAQLVLYDSNSNVIDTLTANASERQTTGVLYYEATTPTVLAEGATVRVICKPTTTTAANLCVENTDPEMTAYTLGTSCQKTSRTDAGAWTDTTAGIVAIGLIVDQVDRAVPFAQAG